MPERSLADAEIDAENARFEAIITVTLRHEGGARIYSNPDTGEFSRFGVTLKFLRSLRPEAKQGDIVDLTEDGAKWLYREYFYDAPHFNQILDTPLLSKVFDVGVNCGPGTSTRLLQRALNAMGHGIVVDGLLGKASIAAVNESDSVTLLGEFRKQARARYELIATRPALESKLPGWLMRLETA